MAELARNVLFDVESGRLVIDGAEIPWAYVDAAPTLVAVAEGEIVPGVTLTLACADISVLAPSKVVSDGE